MTSELNAYHKGPVFNFTRNRDPLSVRYDRAADVLVQRAIAARGGWVTTWIPSPAGEETDVAGLTHHERAFLQAVYYHRLIYMWGSGFDSDGQRRRNSERTHSIKRDWGRVQARGRVLRVRAIRVGEASLYAKERGWTG